MLMTSVTSRNRDELRIQFKLKIPNKQFLCRTNIKSHQTRLHSSSRPTVDSDLPLRFRDI